uniref:Prothymosin alpha n=1 Tax=Spermophilus dauricus TaxID=99837 RepID=A0A8C9PNJ7_SPEDA
MSDAATDTNSEITTKDLKEKMEVVEEAENGREEEVMVRKRMEMKMRRPRQLQANGQLKMMRMMMLVLDSKKGKIKLKIKVHHDLFTLHFPSQNLNVVTFERPAHCWQCHLQMTRALHHPTKTTM